MTRLQRLLPRLKQHFEQLSSENGTFPLLNKNQLDRAWSQFPNVEHREAAILVPLVEFDNGNIHVVFTKRSDRLRSHSAEIAFPGGSREDQDETIIDTALRETQEELRSALRWDIVGLCMPLPSLTGMAVTPVLAAHSTVLTDIDKAFPGCPVEVETVFSHSVQDLVAMETSKPLGRLGAPAPVFSSEYGDIWGLTAFVLRPILHKILVPILLDESEENEKGRSVS